MRTPPLPRHPHRARQAPTQRAPRASTTIARQRRAQAPTDRTAPPPTADTELAELRRALAVEVARRAFPIPDAAAEFITATDTEDIGRQTRLLHVYTRDSNELGPLFVSTPAG